MNTITVKTKKTVEETREIPVPSYWATHSGNLIYGLLNNNNLIRIIINREIISLTQYEGSAIEVEINDYYSDLYKIISKEEFYRDYNNAISTLFPFNPDHECHSTETDHECHSTEKDVFSAMQGGTEQ